MRRALRALAVKGLLVLHMLQAGLCWQCRGCDRVFGSARYHSSHVLQTPSARCKNSPPIIHQVEANARPLQNRVGLAARRLQSPEDVEPGGGMNSGLNPDGLNPDEADPSSPPRMQDLEGHTPILLLYGYYIVYILYMIAHEHPFLQLGPNWQCLKVSAPPSA
jgi:hypothetical protein